MLSKHYTGRTDNLYAYITIGLIACSMLMYEILLTRICALRLYFHFSFLVISNCLLGIGASGAIISVLQRQFEKRVRFWIWLSTILYPLSLAVTYTILLTFNIAPAISLQPMILLRFSIFNLVAAIPFFFSATIIGLILTFNAHQVNKVYGIDLIFAGLGCLFCPLFLWKTGAGGCVVFLALLAVIASMVSVPAIYRFITLAVGWSIIIIGFVLLPNIDSWFPVPSKVNVKITRDSMLNLKKGLFYSKWSAASRVDLSHVAPKERKILGYGTKENQTNVPEQSWIMQDGAAGTFIANFSEQPDGLKTLGKTLYSLAPMLKENPRVFIIGVGGGNDVWAAKFNKASYIKGIELNQQILEIHRSVLYRYSKDIVDDPKIALVFDEGRSALMRDTSRYDIIQMTGIDTWTSLTSGAYVLAENYLYTVEAFRTMYDRLSPNGLISITRFAAEMELLRLISTYYIAVKDRLKGNFDKSVVSVASTDGLATMLAKNGEFSEVELKKIEDMVDREGLEIKYMPGRKLNNIVERFVLTKDREGFIRDFPRDVSATSDDRPYFFNFTKWKDLIGAKRYLYEQKWRAVSQGNPLFLFAQLLLTSILATAFIMLPVGIWKREGIHRRYSGRFLIYFAGLGLGFIFIEMTFVQKLVLFLGHPLYSITVTLFSMLIFTGIGSMLSERWFHSGTSKAWLVALIIAVAVGLFMLLSPRFVEEWILWPKLARIAMTICILAPIGLVLGVPFAYGIRMLNDLNPALIPWAWAINGFMTVVGSILTVILSMNFGFNFVLSAAIIIYCVSFFAIQGLSTPRSP